MRRKAHTRSRLRGFGPESDFALMGCIFGVGLLGIIVIFFGSMARNRLPFDTPEWERQLVFWVVGLSPIVGAITAGAMSIAWHCLKELIYQRQVAFRPRNTSWF